MRTLRRSIGPLANVVALFIATLIVGSIVGINLFAGQFWSCNDNCMFTRDVLGFTMFAAVLTQQECAGDYVNSQGILTSRVWSNPPFSFDNVGAGIMTLFEVATLEGWLDVLNAATDATGVGLQPQYMVQPFMMAYFAIFIIVASFFVIQLVCPFTYHFSSGLVYWCVG